MKVRALRAGNVSRWLGLVVALAAVLSVTMAGPVAAAPAGTPSSAGAADSGSVQRPQGVDGSGHPLQDGESVGAQATAGPGVTREEILARAQVWANSPVPYSQSVFKDGYRTDCSGYVSMAWNTRGNYWTGDLNTIGVSITYNDLRPGDMLLFHNQADPVNGSHVVLFDHWTGRVGGDFVMYEQTPPATKHRTWSAAGYDRSLYKPFRYRNVVEDSSSAVLDNGVLRVFARGADNALWQAIWANGAWTWQSIGGQISSGTSAVLDNGVLRVFARGADGALWRATWAGGAWTWQSVGGRIISGPSAVLDGGLLRVFARGADGALWQAIGAGGSGPTWQSIGGIISSGPAAVLDGDGVLRVFARGADGSAWRATWAASAWTWQSIGAQVSSGPSAVRDGGGALRVFARGTDNASWQAIGADGVPTWQSIGGGITSGPAAVLDGNLLRVFARGTDGALWQAIEGTDGRWTWQWIGGLIV